MTRDRLVVVGPEGPVRDRAAAELARLPALTVDVVDRVETLDPAGGPACLTVLVDPGAAADDVIAATRGTEVGRDASVLLLTDRDHDDLSAAVDGARLCGVVATTWTDGRLAEHVRAQLLREHQRADRPVPDWLRGAATGEEDASGLLRDLRDPEGDVAARLVVVLDEVLGRRPRLRVRAGTRLMQQEHPVDGVYVVRSGQVALERRAASGAPVRLHHETTGPVVGVLALVQRQRAFFTATATTDVELVHVTLEQLDLAVRRDARVGRALAAVTVRALARRLRRSEQLQLERRRLNLELEAERARLEAANAALSAARLELVEQARFATLGELAAGIAHELNNPVAALARATAFVGEDVPRLLTSSPPPGTATLVDQARHRRVPRPAEDRAARRALTAALGDEHLARRLVAAGVTDPDEARTLVAGGEGAVAAAELAAGLGDALRNLEVAASRIAELVQSLRAYARPEQHVVDGVDLHEGLEDALRLVAHRLTDRVLTRDYGTLPPIRCRPGQLGQVWTNLLVNAAEAGQVGGRVTVRTDAPDAAHVRVRIVDDGGGLDPATQDRVFEPRFTTKDGAVRFGLGMGLPLARRLVEAHDGTISLTSEPGATTVTVVLPVRGPATDEGGTT